MTNITFSVIIPMYNAEEYIEQCIQSVLQEENCGLEILVVDDGSTDKSGLIVKQIAVQDERVKYIFQSNQGVSLARNRGLKAAAGKWILFVDADDTIADNTIQKMYEISRHAGSANCVILGCETGEEYIAYPLTKDTREKLLMEACGALPNTTYNANLTSVWGKLYRGSFLKQKQIQFDPDIVMGEDLIFNCNVFVNLEEIIFSSFDYYHYRVNNASATHRKNKSVADCDEKFQLRLINIAKMNKYKRLEKEGCEYSILSGIIISYQAYFSRFHILEYNSYRKELRTFLEKDIYKKTLHRYEEYRNKFCMRYRFVLFCFKNKLYFLPFIVKKVRIPLEKIVYRRKIENEEYN